MMTMWKAAAIAAGVLLSGCQAPPPASDATGSPEGGREPAGEPTKVTPAPDPEAESGPAVPRDQAVPGGPPPAKGGY